MNQSVKLFAAVALAATFAAWAGAQKDKAPQEGKPDPYRLQVNRWAQDAKITREKKDLKEVKKGTYLDLADLLATKLNAIAVFAGKVGVQEIQKNSTLRYVSIKPPKLNPAEDFEFISDLLGGEIYNRVSILTAKSSFIQKIRGKIASSKGTAYSVREEGGAAEVLVAEGEVAVQLEGGGGELRIHAREKATINQTLPTAAIPVTEADEQKIRALLSLPILSLTGYSDPTVLTRKDAEDIVTLGVRNGFLKVTEPDNKVSRTRPNTLFVSAKSLTFITPDGESVDIKNAEFMGAAKDGSVLVAYITGEGLWSFDKDGKRMVKINDTKPQDFSLAPDGRVAFWLAPSKEQTAIPSKDFMRGDPFTGYQRRIGSNFPPDSMEVEWRRGSQLPLLIGKSGSVYFIVNPAALSLPFISQDTIAQAFLISGSTKPGVSPQGEWVWFAMGGGKYHLARTFDGKEFDVTSKTDPRFVPSEKLGDVSEGVVLTDANGQQYAVDPQAPSAQMPVPTPQILEDYQTSATSPNGELVTFRNRPTRTAFVADSQNLARDSDTYVGIGSRYTCGWLDGNEVWYEDDFAGTPESIIITLGIKKLGALPSGPGTVSGDSESGLQDLTMLDDSGFPINEYNVSSIDDDGSVVAIVKFDEGMGGGMGSTRSNSISQLESFGLPFARGRNGSILVNGDALTGSKYKELKKAESERDAKERETGKKDPNWFPPDGLYDYRPVLWRPGKGLIQIPDDKVELDPSPVILDDGKVFISGTLWDPDAKGDPHYLTAQPAYGGEIVFKSTSDDALVAVARNGKRLYARRNARGTYELWLSSTGDKGTLVADTGTRRADVNLVPGANQGRGSTLFFASVAEDGTVCYVDLASSYQIHVIPPGGDTVQADLGKSALIHVYAINRDLCVGYGAPTDPTQEGSGGFVCWKGNVISLNELLPAGWTFHMVRAVSRNGLISGSFFYNGEPRIAIFDLKKLLRGR